MTSGRHAVSGRRLRHLFWSAVVLLAVHACSYLLMAVSQSLRTTALTKAFAFLVSSLFWFPWIGAWIVVAVASRERKRILCRLPDEAVQRQGKPGIICFFSNPLSIAVDSAFLVGIILLAALLRSEHAGFIVYTLLALVSFSLNTHALFNGRIYKIINYINEESQKS